MDFEAQVEIQVLLRLGAAKVLFGIIFLHSVFFLSVFEIEIIITCLIKLFEKIILKNMFSKFSSLRSVEKCFDLDPCG